MSGALALVGSGEYLPEMQDLETKLIKSGLGNGCSNSYVQLATAAGAESQSRLDHWQALGREQANRIGAKPIFLPVFEREHAFNESIIELIDKPALIYFSGGDPSYLVKSLVNTPLLAKIRQSWMLGSAVAGCSAGAMAMGFDVPNFFRPVHDGITGFNFVGKIRTIPHFDKYFGWVPDSAAKFVTRAPANTTVLGIDELTALANGIDSDNWQVYGLGHVHLLKGDPLGKFSAGHRFLGGSLS